MLSNYFYVLDSLCCSSPEAISLGLMAKGLQVMDKLIIFCPWRILIAYQDDLLTTDLVNLLNLLEWMTYISFVQPSSCITSFNYFYNSFAASNLRSYFLARLSSACLPCRGIDCLINGTYYQMSISPSKQAWNRNRMSNWSQNVTLWISNLYISRTSHCLHR